MHLKHCAIDATTTNLGQILVMINKLVTLFIVIATSICTAAQSQNLVGFDRGSFGSTVLSQTQSAGSDVQLELSIGSYENEPIINYQGTIFAEIGRSVGRLAVLTDKGLFPCTAFIVSKKYILTNYHCSLGLLDNEQIGATRIEATQFVAGYVQTGIDEGTDKYTVVPIPIESSEKLDYAVLEVIGNPSQDYGELKLASMVPNDRTPFWVIGHPQGKGQHISREKCRASSPAVSKAKLLHTCDTLPGNSGSPVIDAGLQQVVALHHAGSKADSVNFAILMSEILANSEVLAAYKAPLSVQPETPKTAEITACDALYSEAKEAKACYAYEAYFKSCRSHSLAPIANGYIKEFCQVQAIAKVEKAPKKTVVKKECSASNVDGCSAAELCKNSTVPNGNTRVWKTFVSVFKTEAIRRGYDCDVGRVNAYNIKQAFISQSKLKRQQLQYALKKLGYYSFGIDGLWGKGTASGFDKFVNRNGLKGKTEAQVLSSLLSKVKVPNSFGPKPTSSPKTQSTILNDSFNLPAKWRGKYCGYSVRFSFRNKRVLAGKLRYNLTISLNGYFYHGHAEITGQTFRFDTKHTIKGWRNAGYGRFNEQYTRVSGKAGHCSFELSIVR